MRRYALPPGSLFTTGTFLLLDRRVVECVCRFQEQSRIVFALVAWTGFEQAVVLYDRAQRIAGKSGWNFSKMIRTMHDALIGFSSLPIRLMTLLGGLAFLVAGGLSIYLLSAWTFGHPVPGWTSIMFGMSFFFGIQFIMMGLSGEYLHRIYLEVVKRPLYFLSDQTGPGRDEAGVPTHSAFPHTHPVVDSISSNEEVASHVP
jgi:dolichol-phosphate mannosyltransferase